jgi:5-methylcytosine-specific restriction endonuclease McrA
VNIVLLPVSRKEARIVNSKFFKSGKKCPAGHDSKRLTSNGTCYSCSKDRLEKWTAKKEDKKQKIDLLKGLFPKKYATENGLKRYLTGKACANGHYAERRASDSKCMDCVKNKNRKRRKENPEYFKKCLSDFHERNPGYFVSMTSKRRARKNKCSGHYTALELRNLLEVQKYRCCYCGKDLKKTGHHADHIMPLALGGDGDIGNIQCLCPTCNLRKGCTDPIVWAQKELGMLL